jgi:hypothetical protein
MSVVRNNGCICIERTMRYGDLQTSSPRSATRISVNVSRAADLLAA